MKRKGTKIPTLYRRIGGGGDGGRRQVMWLAGSMLSWPVCTRSKYRRIGRGDDGGRRGVTWLAGLE